MTSKTPTLRFDTLFPVTLSSQEFGSCQAIARHVSAHGVVVEMTDPLPIGTEVEILFSNEASQAQISAVGQVRNHYFFNYQDHGEQRSITGVVIRLQSFERSASQEPLFSLMH